MDGSSTDLHSGFGREFVLLAIMLYFRLLLFRIDDCWNDQERGTLLDFAGDNRPKKRKYKNEFDEN